MSILKSEADEFYVFLANMSHTVPPPAVDCKSAIIYPQEAQKCAQERRNVKGSTLHSSEEGGVLETERLW